MKRLLLIVLLSGCTCQAPPKPKPDPVVVASASASVAAVDAAPAPITACAVNVAKKRTIAAQVDQYSLAAVGSEARLAVHTTKPLFQWNLADVTDTLKLRDLPTPLASVAAGASAFYTFEQVGTAVRYGTATITGVPYINDDFAFATHGDDWLGLGVGPEVDCGARVCVTSTGDRLAGTIVEEGRIAYVLVALSAKGTTKLHDKRCPSEKPPKKYDQGIDFDYDYCKDAEEHSAHGPAVALDRDGALIAYRLDSDHWIQRLTTAGAAKGGRHKLASNVVGRASIASNTHQPGGAGFLTVYAHNVGEHTEISSSVVTADDPAPAKLIARGTTPSLASSAAGNALAFISDNGALAFAFAKTDDFANATTITGAGKTAREPRVTLDARSGFLAWLESSGVDAGASAELVLAPIECH